jgi:phasin family protein
MDFAASHQHDLSFDIPPSGLLDMPNLTEFVMSNLNIEQSIAAQKVRLDATFGILSTTFENIEKLVGLNLQAFKSILAKNQEIATGVLSAKDPREFLSLKTGQVQPAVEKAQSYWRHAYEIVSNTQVELAADIGAEFKRYQTDYLPLVESLAKNAPAGGDIAVSAWKSAIETASAAFETALKATKQVTESNGGDAPVGPSQPAKGSIEQAEAAEEQ